MLRDWGGLLPNRAMSCMNDRSFVDTNILIYAHDSSTGEKHFRAATVVNDLWDSGVGVLSTQVLQELCVSLQRKCAVVPSAAEIRRIVQDYMSWQIVTNAADAVLHALDLQAQFRVSFWDAMILHAAESGGCGTLYSEDFGHNRTYGSIRVVNPFE